MIAPGEYTGVVTAHALGRTGKGREQLAIAFRVDVGDGTSQELTWYGYFTDRARPTTIKALQNLGFDFERHDWRVSALNGTDVLVGVEATVVVEHEAYTDREGRARTTARIRWVNRPGGLALKERMDEAEAASFDNDLRAKLVTETRGQGGGGAVQQRPRQQRAQQLVSRPSAPPASFTPPGEFDPADIPF